MNTVLYKEVKDILTSKEKFHIELGLGRITKVLNAFENPHKKIKCIHIAGTNGKGSVCIMLSNILTNAGYKTGLYTSPHILKYDERIKINNIDISDEELNNLTKIVLDKADEEDVYLTEFEILTVCAFLYFAKNNADIAILETGLGGRLDATNVVQPVLSIITSIDMDHTERLGDSIEKIAYEKAGIIKSNAPVVISKDNRGEKVIEQKTKETNSPLLLTQDSDDNFFDGEFNNIKVNGKIYKTSLLGKYQAKNLPLVLKAIEYLNEKTDFKISEKSIAESLKKVSWPARMQFFREYNTIIDGAHNLDAAKLLRKTIDEYFPDKKIAWFYASLKNKDYPQIVKELFKPGDEIFINDTFSKNAASSDDIQKLLPDKCINIKNSPEEITNLIKTNKDKLLIVAGSLYFAGFVQEHLLK